MNLLEWHPLYPGEKPGDPELGGWRPMIRTKINNSKTRKQRRIGLLEALHFLSHQIEQHNINAAINFIALKVIQTNI